MSITIYDPAVPGVARKCDTEGCGANAVTVWSTGVIAGGVSAGHRYSCERHNPFFNIAAPIPMGFASATLCHACGQPVPVTGK